MSPDLRITFDAPPRALRLGPHPVAPASRPAAAAVKPAAGASPAAGPATSPQSPADRATRVAPPPAARPAVDALARQRLGALLDRLEREVDGLESRLRADLEALRPAVVDLAVTLAERILRREIDRGSLDVVALVQDGLARVTRGASETTPILVRVAPAERALLESALADQGLAVTARLRVEEDPALGPLACVIECGMRRITVDLERELLAMREALLAPAGTEGGS